MFWQNRSGRTRTAALWRRPPARQKPPRTRQTRLPAQPFTSPLLETTGTGIPGALTLALMWTPAFTQAATRLTSGRTETGMWVRRTRGFPPPLPVFTLAAGICRRDITCKSTRRGRKPILFRISAPTGTGSLGTPTLMCRQSDPSGRLGIPELRDRQDPQDRTANPHTNTLWRAAIPERRKRLPQSWRVVD